MTVRFSTPYPDTRPVEEATRFLHPAAAKTGLGDKDGAEAVSYFQGHYRWRFLGKHDDDYSPGNPNYSRVKPGSAVMDSEAMIENMLNVGAAAHTHIEKLLKSGEGDDLQRRIWLGESEHFKKLTVQKGYYPAYWLQPDPIKQRSLPDWFKRRLRDTLAMYLREGDARIHSVPLPTPVINTSASWPVYQPGIGSKVISSSFYAPGVPFARLRAEAQEWAAHHNLEPSATFGNAYGTRTGPLAKYTRDWRPVGDGFYSDTESISTHTRRRQIYMAPMPSFLALRYFTRVAKATRATVLRGAWHAGGVDEELTMMANSMPGEWWEFDVAGYDTTIWRLIHLEIAAACSDVFGPQSRMAQEALDYAMIDDIGTIYPRNDGYGTDNRRAVYVTRSGFLSSGILPTAEIGNIIHQPIIDEFLFRSGYRDPIRERQTGRVITLLQGDDLLVHAEGIEEEMVKEVYAEVGLTAKVVRSNRFLMKFRDTGKAYPVAGRILQQTAFNEHETTGRHALAFAIIGLAARWGEGPHPSMIPLLRETLSHTKIGVEEGIVDGPSATKWLTSAKGSTAVTRALESAAGAAWFSRHVREAEYKPSSAAIVEFARRLGFTDLSASETTIGKMAVSKMISSSPQQKSDIRETLWRAFDGGLSLDALDVLALKLLNLKKLDIIEDDGDDDAADFSAD